MGGGRGGCLYRARYVLALYLLYSHSPDFIGPRFPIVPRLGKVESILRVILHPLPSQTLQHGRQLPVTLGSVADAYILGRQVTDTEAVKILRAWLWNNEMESFACVVAHELRWTTADAQALWDMINLPSFTD